MKKLPFESICEDGLVIQPNVLGLEARTWKYVICDVVRLVPCTYYPFLLSEVKYKCKAFNQILKNPQKCQSFKKFRKKTTNLPNTFGLTPTQKRSQIKV